MNRLEAFEHEVLTVARLRELLAGVPDDFVVLAEGCDCIGAAGDIEVRNDEHEVLIGRHPEYMGGGSPRLDAKYPGSAK